MATGVLAGCQWELNSFLTVILIKIHVIVIFLEEPSILFIGIFLGLGFITIKHLTQPLPQPGSLQQPQVSGIIHFSSGYNLSIFLIILISMAGAVSGQLGLVPNQTDSDAAPT